jgi:hypothetical protein
VALQVFDVLLDFHSCVLCCSQFSLNLLVQSPEGIRGVICVADDGGDIWWIRLHRISIPHEVGSVSPWFESFTCVGKC